MVGGRIDDVAATSSEGIGVRVRVGGGWGFAATRDVTPAGAEAALRARAGHRRGPARRPGAPLAPVAARARPLVVQLRDRPVRGRARGQARRCCSPPRRRCAATTRIVRSAAGSTARRERKAFASTEGAACTQERDRRAAPASRPTRVDGSELQVRSYPLRPRRPGRRGRLGARRSALDLAAHAPRVAAEAVELLSAPPCPEGVRTIVLHGEQVALQIHESIGHALELDRIQLGEASYAGTSFVAVEDLGAPALRLRAPDDHGRRDAARRPRARSAGTTRACRRRATRAHRRRPAAGRAVRPRVGRGRRPGRARAAARARTASTRQPIVRMTNVSHRARRRRLARRPPRRHRRRPVPRDEPLVVDRRPPPAVPVRHGAGARDPRRRARAAVPQPLLRRRSRRGSGARSTRSCGPAGVARLGPDELRQGRARPGHGRLARRRAGALPRRPGRRRVTTGAERVLDLAERALGHLGGGDAQATVVARALAVLALRPLAADAGHRRSTTRRCTLLRAARRPHRAPRAPTTAPTTGLRAAARRADAAARAAARRRRPRRPPGPARARSRPRPHDGFDLATAALDPGAAGAALRAAFDACAERRPRGLRPVDGRATSRRRSPRRTGVRARDAVTDAYLKVIARDDDRAHGLGRRRVDRGARPRRRRRSRAAPPPRSPRASRSSCRPATTPSCSSPTPSASCCSSSAGWRFNGLAHAEGRGALTGRLGTPRRRAGDQPQRLAALRRARCPRAFDFEGVPKAPMPLIQDGVAHARRARHAARPRAPATARARPATRSLPGGSPDGPVPTNLVLIGGGAADERELAAPIERGLYVTRLWYVNPVHERSDAADRHDPRRHVPDRGRPDRPPACSDVRFTDSVLPRARTARRR